MTSVSQIHKNIPDLLRYSQQRHVIRQMMRSDSDIHSSQHYHHTQHDNSLTNCRISDIMSTRSQGQMHFKNKIKIPVQNMHPTFTRLPSCSIAA